MIKIAIEQGGSSCIVASQTIVYSIDVAFRLLYNPVLIIKLHKMVYS